ncbi:MAG: hypothetical protein L3J31_09185 [Bacteroidales bacterium]|nr:hypothetical protein [Bacteroidales bacterium]
MKRLLFSVAMFFSLSFSFAQLEMPAIEDLPVRLTRSFGISMDMGWNGLVGFGPTIQYYVSPHVGIDGGIGLSATGLKFGARGRYLFLEKIFTPFAGAGFNYGMGFGGSGLSVLTNDDNGNVIDYYVKPSAFLQLTAGGDLLTGGGFFLLFDMGYSILLSEDNIVIVSGTPTVNQQQGLKGLHGSGIVIEVGIGFVFKNNRGIH